MCRRSTQRALLRISVTLIYFWKLGYLLFIMCFNLCFRSCVMCKLCCKIVTFRCVRVARRFSSRLSFSMFCSCRKFTAACIIIPLITFLKIQAAGYFPFYTGGVNIKILLYNSWNFGIFLRFEAPVIRITNLTLSYLLVEYEAITSWLITVAISFRA
jgi:hypothetical protein